MTTLVPSVPFTYTKPFERDEVCPDLKGRNPPNEKPFLGADTEELLHSVEEGERSRRVDSRPPDPSRQPLSRDRRPEERSFVRCSSGHEILLQVLLCPTVRLSTDVPGESYRTPLLGRDVSYIR